MSMVSMTPVTVNVDVRSAWYSKINWAQGIAFLAMLGTYFGIDLDAQTQASVLAAITGVTAVVTWAFRTFGTKTITPSSLPA